MTIWKKRTHTQLVGKILFRIHPPPFSRVQKCAFSGDFFPNHFMLWFLSLQDLKAPTTPTKGSNLKRCAIHSTAAQGSTKELGQCEVSIQVFQFIACNDGMVDLLKKNIHKKWACPLKKVPGTFSKENPTFQIPTIDFQQICDFSGEYAELPPPQLFPGNAMKSVKGDLSLVTKHTRRNT